MSILRSTHPIRVALIGLTFGWASASPAWVVQSQYIAKVIDRSVDTSYLCSGTCTGCRTQEYAPATWLEGILYKMLIHSNDPGDNCPNNNQNFFDYIYYAQSSSPTSGYSTPVLALCPSDTMQGCIDKCTDDFCTPSTSCPPSPILCDPAVEDVLHVGDPTVVKVGSTYYMYFNAPIEDTSRIRHGEQIYLATSYDAVHWMKYPCWAGDSTCSQAPQPVIAFPQAERDANAACGIPYQTLPYGRRQPSVVYKGGKFILFYTYITCDSIYDWSHVPGWWGLEVNTYRAESNNGYDFGTLAQHTPIYALLAQADVGDMVDADLFYYAAGDVYFLVSGNIDDANIYWNISRDGKHWLPYSNTNPTRIIQSCSACAINHNAGWLRNTDGTGSLSTYAYYGAGPALSSTNCITQHAFLKWDIHSSSVSIQPESIIGGFGGVDASCVAYGWAYDPDRGSNDDGANDFDDDGNGFRSNALGNHTQVKVYSNSINKGTFNASVFRQDPKDAGLAPDVYHGYEINLNSILSPGIQTVTIKGIEFPGETTETQLSNSLEVNVGNCTLSEVSPPGALNPLRIEKSTSSPTGYYLYFAKTVNARGYNVYEGDIGNYYNHGGTPNYCNLAYQTTVTPGKLRYNLVPSTGSHYYLITAYSANQESSPGNGTNGPRPIAQSTCPP